MKIEPFLITSCILNGKDKELISQLAIAPDTFRFIFSC
jgi:hypothetical protein